MIEQLYIIALGSAHSALILPQYGIADPGEFKNNLDLPEEHPHNLDE